MNGSNRVVSLRLEPQGKPADVSIERASCFSPTGAAMAIRAIAGAASGAAAAMVIGVELRAR